VCLCVREREENCVCVLYEKEGKSVCVCALKARDSVFVKQKKCECV